MPCRAVSCSFAFVSPTDDTGIMDAEAGHHHKMAGACALSKSMKCSSTFSQEMPARQYGWHIAFCSAFHGVSCWRVSSHIAPCCCASHGVPCRSVFHCVFIRSAPCWCVYLQCSLSASSRSAPRWCVFPQCSLSVCLPAVLPGGLVSSRSGPCRCVFPQCRLLLCFSWCSFRCVFPQWPL